MNETLNATFNSEASIYDSTVEYLMLDYHQVLSEVLSCIDFESDDSFTILDAGCGTGNLIKLLAERFPKATIYGLDFSSEMLDVAQKKNLSATFIEGDIFNVENMPLPNFDLIVVSFVFHNFSNDKEHLDAMKKLNNMLSVNGKLIVADLIDPGNECNVKESKLVSLMKKHQLSDVKIENWIETLRKEDRPLTLKRNVELLSETNYTDVLYRYFPDSYSAIFVASKVLDTIQLKAELISYGVRPNDYSCELYCLQNPKNITKTGNNGIFLTVNGLDVLVGINHTVNADSPYIFEKNGNDYILSKNGKCISAAIEPIHIPDWAFYPVHVHSSTYNKFNDDSNDQFSNYFVYEGHGYIHLAYKACSFNDCEKCRFCSVKRREDGADNSSEDICNALRDVLKFIPDTVHICLGGGTYIPFSKNVEYFEDIAKLIRSEGKKNPIWIEMIPPEIDQIQRLIDAGATSFGFNIEIWDNDTRKILCPGKSAVPKEQYISAFKYVIDVLGADRVGSCLIVGLDKRENLISAIDELLEMGVQPCILLFKDYDTQMDDISIPVQYLRDFYFISKYAAEKAKMRNMYFKNSQGCLKCNCCTIMHDLQNI